MPQFDPTSFSAQLFWLVLLFGLLWLILARAGLPRVERIFQDREQRIANDLDMAERLSAEADKVQAAYEQSLAEARATSQAAFAKSHAKVAETLAARSAQVEAELGKRLNEAENRIASAEGQAMAELGKVVSDTAEQMLRQLSQPVDPEALQSAVNDALGDMGQAS